MMVSSWEPKEVATRGWRTSCRMLTLSMWPAWVVRITQFFASRSLMWHLLPSFSGVRTWCPLLLSAFSQDVCIGS